MLEALKSKEPKRNYILGVNVPGNRPLLVGP